MKFKSPVFQVYSRENCVHCNYVISRLEELGYGHTVLKVGGDLSKEEFMETFPGAKTVPQIKVDGEHLGGRWEFDTYMAKFWP